MGLPSNISYGTVTGQFILALADGSDADLLPDSVPASGTVTFQASAQIVMDYSASPNPVTIARMPIVCPLDSNGYLCSPYQSPTTPLSQGVSLIATDDPYIQPQGWTWTVFYSLVDTNGKPIPMPTYSIQVPTNGTVDLTTVTPVPASNGVYYTKGDPASLTVGTVSQGPSAAANITGQAPNQTLNLTMPVNSLSIGTVSTLSPGSSATASVSGSAPSQTLSLGIPQGAKGYPGDLTVSAVNNGVSGTATISGDSDLPSTKNWTLTGNTTVTVNNPTANPTMSGTVSIAVTQDATGGRTFTWPSNIKWSSGVTPQPASAANAISLFHLFWTGTQWLGMQGGNAFA